MSKSTEIVPHDPSSPDDAPPDRVRPRHLYALFLSDSPSENTRRARVHDVEILRRTLGAATPESACAQLIRAGRGNANALALALRESEMARGQSPSSINRLLAHIRKLAVLGRLFDLCSFAIDVRDLPNIAYVDTRGGGEDAWVKVWGAAEADRTFKGLRNRAVLRLLHDGALRIGEAMALDVADLDLAGSRIALRGKGRGGCREWFTINRVTVKALAAWVEILSPEQGPLFVRFAPFDPAGWIAFPYERLSARSFNRILVELSRRAGLSAPVHPHQLRHGAVTAALDATNGNVRMVQCFSRHKSIATVMRYDDNRQDLGGVVARLIGGEGPTDASPIEETAEARRRYRPRKSCQTKLDDDQVAEMRRLASEGWKRAALARKFGVHPQTVRAAVLGLTHCHVPFPD